MLFSFEPALGVGGGSGDDLSSGSAPTSFAFKIASENLASIQIPSLQFPVTVIGSTHHDHGTRNGSKSIYSNRSHDSTCGTSVAIACSQSHH